MDTFLSFPPDNTFLTVSITVYQGGLALSPASITDHLQQASSWGDRERRVVTRLVVCRREGVERMVVRWAGVKSSTSFSTTNVD